MVSTVESTLWHALFFAQFVCICVCVRVKVVFLVLNVNVLHIIS